MTTHSTQPVATKAVQATAHAGTDAAAHATHNLIDRVAEHAENSEQKIRASAQLAQQTLKSSWRSARAKSAGAKKSVNGFVRRHPFASLGLALGLGALLMTRAKQRALPANTAVADETPVH